MCTKEVRIEGASEMVWGEVQANAVARAMNARRPSRAHLISD